MPYGYVPVDPVKVFQNVLGHYDKFINVAIEMGYTKDQAIELLKVWALKGIEEMIGSR